LFPETLGTFRWYLFHFILNGFKEMVCWKMNNFFGPPCTSINITSNEFTHSRMHARTHARTHSVKALKASNEFSDKKIFSIHTKKSRLSIHICRSIATPIFVCTQLSMLVMVSVSQLKSVYTNLITVLSKWLKLNVTSQQQLKTTQDLWYLFHQGLSSNYIVSEYWKAHNNSNIMWKLRLLPVGNVTACLRCGGILKLSLHYKFTAE